MNPRVLGRLAGTVYNAGLSGNNSETEAFVRGFFTALGWEHVSYDTETGRIRVGHSGAVHSGVLDRPRLGMSVMKVMLRSAMKFADTLPYIQ